MHLKILPLGAPIVWGQDSSDGNGFRKHLLQTLEANGNPVSYVGTVFHGNMIHNACEAFPGHTIQEVANLGLQNHVYDYLPNVVLVHVGTNDCWANESARTMASRFAWMLSSIKSRDPGALVLASNLIQNLNTAEEKCIEAFNAQLPGVVSKAVKGGQKVALVDLHSAILKGDIHTSDGTHPTDAGYALMAQVWYKALVNHAGMISAPNAGGKAAPI